MLNAPHVVHTCSTFSSSPGWITIYINTVLIVEFWEHDVRTSVGFAVIESEHDQWTPLVSVVGTSVRGTSVRGTRYEVRGTRYEVRGTRYEVRGAWNSTPYHCFDVSAWPTADNAE